MDVDEIENGGMSGGMYIFRQINFYIGVDPSQVFNMFFGGGGGGGFSSFGGAGSPFGEDSGFGGSPFTSFFSSGGGRGGSTKFKFSF